MKEIKLKAFFEGRMVPCEVSLDGIVHALIDGEMHIIGTMNETPDGLLKGVPVVQYTGIRDCDGKEIYEEDILELRWDDDDIPARTLKPVEFRDGGFIVYDDFDDYDMTNIGWATDIWDNDGVRWSVLGNRYENPELLEGE